MDVSNCDLHFLPEDTIVQIIHQGQRVTGEVQARLELMRYEIAFDENPNEKFLASVSQIKTKGNTFKIGDEIEVNWNQSTARVCKIFDHSVYLIVLLVSGQYEWCRRSEVIVRTNHELSVEEPTPQEDSDEGDAVKFCGGDRNMCQANQE